MSSFGMFESDAAQGMVHEYDKNLKLATDAIRRKYYDFVNAGHNDKDRKARLALYQDEIAAIASQFVTPTASTMRRVNASLKVESFTSPISTWEYDHAFNGWKSSCADTQNFLCTGCGRALAKLGFQHCRCGKIWNGYTITDESKTSSVPVTVWREAEDTGMKLASTDTVSGDELQTLLDEAPEITYEDPEGIDKDAYLITGEDEIVEDDQVVAPEQEDMQSDMTDAPDIPQESPGSDAEALPDDEGVVTPEDDSVDSEDEYVAAYKMGYRKASTGYIIHDNPSDGFLDGYLAFLEEN